MNEQQINHAQRITNNNRDLRRHVSRLVFRSKSLRPDDIARTISNQVQCSDSGLLGIAGNVAGYEGE